MVAPLRGFVVVALGLCACRPVTAPRSPDLLLVTLDTTRADAVGAYGADPSPTPHVDALAAKGAWFSEAVAVCPLTLPAHASLMTGLYPDRHGVRTNDGFSLTEDRVTLAAALRSSGYHTGAFVAAAVLDRVFGLDQGFEHYDDAIEVRTATSGVPARPAEEVADQANTWIARTVSADPGAPLFAWVHLYDPHQPLDPPADLLRLHPDPYLAEVARVDRAVGQILDNLRALGREDLLVVVAGDHGEGRGDHGEAYHGLFVYRSTVRVPLVLAGAGIPSGHAVSTPISQVDVAPTVLDLLGLDVPEGLDGRSLAAHLRAGTDPAPVPVFGESYHPRIALGLSELRFVQDEAHRFVLAPRSELYRWTEDPAEGRDLAAVSNTQPFRALIEAQARRAGAQGTPVAQGVSDPALQAQLAALGYAGGVTMVDPSVTFDVLPDPKDHADIVSVVDTLARTARTREPERAVAMLEGFLQEYPNVAAARLLLSEAERATGDLDGALAALEPLLRARPEDPNLATRWSALRLQAGVPEARGELEALLRSNPDLVGARAVLAEHLRVEGRAAEALDLVEEALRSEQGPLVLQMVRGACLLDLGDANAAASVLGDVLARDPANRDVRYHLARALGQQGAVAEALQLARAQAELTPGDLRVDALQGLLLYSAGRASEARPFLVRAASDPDLTGHEPLVALADLEGRDGNLEEAWALLDRAEALEPRPLASLQVRAALLMEQGRIEEARAVLARLPAGSTAPRGGGR
jgi:arylsulfatase A-like enzyme/tetratricopeptide (TPR) repeat protein